MQFEDVQTTLQTESGEIAVTVTADAIAMLWDADGGPQTGEQLVEQYRAMIDDAVRDVLETSPVPMRSITITEEDLAGDEPMPGIKPGEPIWSE